ncbi:SapC family protein [Sphingomonas sp. G-3-2-10]|uniref:SapC family protein n=1 Tax=Sphingomonas sp. G-3-2-10 TaxID=2728838 RepID=UPI00146DFB2A|nr:SapC family protein [Sphingomonas sp. G-3-2-10]NML06494.1 SapC family protein [Sphingomonas sp. G-3-2-10]
MASAPQSQPLPLFYKDLVPLSSQVHADFRIRPATTAPFVVGSHAIPLTVEEFPLAQRFMPIVFSVGDEPLPLALFGLNEGVNVFFDDDGKIIDDNFYVPAYIRRYPYLLARLRPDSDELSLCFDPSTDTIGAFEEGEKLFDGDQPSELTKNILDFNRQFEEAGQRTAQFVKELKELDLLMDGEVSIQPDGAEQPFVYRGFQMVDESKLNELRGDQLRKIVQSGMLPLIYAHLFSLSQMREVFGRQVQQGKMPAPQLVTPV